MSWVACFGFLAAAGVSCAGGPAVADGGAEGDASDVRDGAADTDAESDVCSPACWLENPYRLRICDDGCGGSTCGSCPSGLACLEGFWCRSTVGCGDRCAEQVLVPSGPFLQGCDPERYRGGTNYCVSDTLWPLHEVQLSSYLIDRFEVTNGRYAACIAAGACLRPSMPCLRYLGLPEDWATAAEFAEYPVICLNWDAADTFCRWDGRRLPTEAEWEKAARGGCETHGDPLLCDQVEDAPTFVWGNDETLVAPGSPGGCYPPEGSCVVNIDNVYTYRPAPAGSFPDDASPYGVMDLGGNLSEWVDDWYDPFLYPGCSDPCVDPVGDAGDRVSKVYRGSTFGMLAFADLTSLPVFGRPADGYPLPADAEYMGFGFRCASDP